MFSFCQYGGPSHFQGILVALGNAEAELVTGEKFRNSDTNKIAPIAGLSTEWANAAFDDSPEFEIALALSGVFDPGRKLGSIRTNMESVEPKGRSHWQWVEGSKAVAWSSANLISNLSSILERRMIDSNRESCEIVPLFSTATCSLESASLFIHGLVDDERISSLLWGLILLDHVGEISFSRTNDAPPLPRAFALLKPMFQANHAARHEGQKPIKPDGEILSLLRSSRLGEACVVAARRLRSSGNVPMTSRRGGSRDDTWLDAVVGIDPRRLLASLLIPVSTNDSDRLIGLIARPESETRKAAL